MARKLSKDAKSKLLDNATLFAEVCNIIDVKPVSLSQLVYRNSPWLTNHDVVLKIASAMNKSVDEILEETEEAATA